jgi:hypothetical protein
MAIVAGHTHAGMTNVALIATPRGKMALVGVKLSDFYFTIFSLVTEISSVKSTAQRHAPANSFSNAQEGGNAALGAHAVA